MQQEAGTGSCGQLPAGRCGVEIRPASSRWHPGLTHVLSSSGLCKQHCGMQDNKSKGFSSPLAGWLTGPEEFLRSVGQVEGSVQSRQRAVRVSTPNSSPPSPGVLPGDSVGVQVERRAEARACWPLPVRICLSPLPSQPPGQDANLPGSRDPTHPTGEPGGSGQDPHARKNSKHNTRLQDCI